MEINNTFCEIKEVLSKKQNEEDLFYIYDLHLIFKNLQQAALVIVFTFSYLQRGYQDKYSHCCFYHKTIVFI